MFVLASSQRVYPLQPAPCVEDEPLAPDSPYGYAKWVAELWCRMASEQFGLTTRVLRFFSVYGPGQQANGGSGVVTIFASAALRATTAGASSRRSARLYGRARCGARHCADDRRCRPTAAHRVYNVATGRRHDVSASWPSWSCDLTGSRSTVEAELREPPGRDLVADIARARAELGFEAEFSLRDGVDRTSQWLGSRPRDAAKLCLKARPTPVSLPIDCGRSTASGRTALELYLAAADLADAATLDAAWPRASRPPRCRRTSRG